MRLLTFFLFFGALGAGETLSGTDRLLEVLVVPVLFGWAAEAERSVRNMEG